MQTSIRIMSELVRDVRPMRFREGGKLHYKIRIYLDADNLSELGEIASVQYELHPSFRQRYLASQDRSRSFEIIIWSYGFFDVKAKIFKLDGEIIEIKGPVRWKVDAAYRNTYREFY